MEQPLSTSATLGLSAPRRMAAAIAFATAFAFGIGSSAIIAPSFETASVSAQSAEIAPVSLADAAEQADQAVVTVTTLQDISDAQLSQIQGSGQLPPGTEILPGTGRDDNLLPLGSGSGFIIDTIGHVVTNNHVVESGTAFQVTYYDGSTDMATLVGADPFQDVAVLQITLDAGESVPATINFGDSDAIRAGEPVVAIGNPYGEYANTITTGVINALDRGLDTGGGYSLPNLIQHDAAIYPGNSGGPLVDANGEVVGINVAKAYTGSVGANSGEGFNFAIESNSAKVVVDEILKDGSFERAYLGILGQATGYGVEVAEIQAGGPAEEAGLEAGDVIVGVVGVPGDDPNEALDTILFDRRPGDEITLEVIRDNAETQVSIVLAERPQASPQ